MVTYKGATVKLVIERLTAETKIPKEFIGATDGLGGAETFYTKNFPITTGAGATTDVETEVDVFKRTAGTTSWTELSDAGDEFTITGATGEVVIAAGVNSAVFQISISYYTTAEVGSGQSASIDFDGGLEEIYHMGSRDPKEIKEGQKSLSGTIEHLYCTRDLLGKFLGESDLYQKLTAFSFYLYPNKEVQGQPQIKLEKVKFGGGSISVDQGGIMVANVTYKGLVIAVGTVPAP